MMENNNHNNKNNIQALLKEMNKIKSLLYKINKNIEQLNTNYINFNQKISNSDNNDKNVILNEDIEIEEKVEDLKPDTNNETANTLNSDQILKEENTESQNQSSRLSIADLIKNTSHKTKNK